TRLSELLPTSEHAKIKLIPNGIALPDSATLPQREEARQRLGLGLRNIGHLCQFGNQVALQVRCLLRSCVHRQLSSMETLRLLIMMRYYYALENVFRQHKRYAGQTNFFLA
ncbi:MAG: hypothetical protein ACOYD3_13840, partial [Kiritimatiellia bacterium]